MSKLDRSFGRINHYQCLSKDQKILPKVTGHDIFIHNSPDDSPHQTGNVIVFMQIFRRSR